MDGDIIFSNIDSPVTAYTRFVRVDNVFFECQSFGTPATADTTNPGFVMDGVRCGNSSVSRTVLVRPHPHLSEFNLASINCNLVQ